MNERECFFFIIGCLTFVILISIGIILLLIFLCEFITNYKNKKKYKYMIEHRFDEPPIAKCYCIDCKYCYGKPTNSGSGVYCSLFNGDMIIIDNAFCYRAEPKSKE